MMTSELFSFLSFSRDDALMASIDHDKEKKGENSYEDVIIHFPAEPIFLPLTAIKVSVSLLSLGLTICSQRSVRKMVLRKMHFFFLVNNFLLIIL
jgi:hypothetical protein